MPLRPILEPAQPPRAEAPRGRAAGTPARGAARSAVERDQASDAVRLARQLIGSTYLGLHRKSHYEVLGVIGDTDAAGIEVAYRVKRKHFDLGRYRDLDLGEAYAHLEEIVAALDAAYGVLKQPQTRASYDEQLAAQRGSGAGNAAMRAEDCYQRGKELLQRGHHADALLAFADARRLQDQPLYRAEEALAHFLGHGRTATAGAEAMLQVQEALAADPRHPAPYVAAGRISLALDAGVEGVQHLQEAIRLDPTRSEAFELLEQHWRGQQRFDCLEEEYRRTIFLLGNADRRWAVALWKRLARLYREQLGDERRALLAAKAALKLDPADTDLRRQVAQGDAADPRRWADAVTGFRAALRADPRDRAALQQLFQLHREAGRLEPARDVAAAAMLRGVANTDQLRFIAEQTTAPPVAAVPILGEQQWAVIRHPEADPGLTELFRLVAPLLSELHPTLPGVAGAPPPVAAETVWRVPPTQELARLARQLEVPEPRLVLSPLAGDAIEAFDGAPPVLIVGPSALEPRDDGMVEFRLARALAQLRPGWIAACGREVALLQDYLVACVEVWRLDLDLAGAEPRREAARVQHVARALRGRKTLVDAGVAWAERWSGEGAPSARRSVARWLTGVQRSADRAALLLGGDLVAAGRVVAERDPVAEAALIDFALSAEYAEARQRLLPRAAPAHAER